MLVLCRVGGHLENSAAHVYSLTWHKRSSSKETAPSSHAPIVTHHRYDEELLIHSMGAYMFMCESENASLLVMPDSLQPLGLEPTGLLSPWDFPGKNTGVGSHSLFQGTFLTQGVEPGSPALQEDFLLPEPPGKPPCSYTSSQVRGGGENYLT